MTANDGMTKAERLELAKVVRLRAKVAKDATSQRAAELLADVESQLAAKYSIDHAAWRDLTDEAQKTVAEADAQLAERCRALGIPERFRPALQLGWWDRGENAVSKRRVELRKVAQTRIAALERAAKVEIDRQALEQQTTLVAGGLESGDARTFLDRMPSVDSLMPSLSLPELERGQA